MLTVGGDLVHQPRRRGDAVGRRLAVQRDRQQQVGGIDAEDDDRGPAVRDGAAAYLAQRGGYPDLILLLEGQDDGEPASELTRREDADQIPDVQGGELTGHRAGKWGEAWGKGGTDSRDPRGEKFSTRMPASSR